MQHVTARILASPQRVAGVGGTFKFVVTGESGGTWLVRCADPVAVTEGDGESDITVTVSAPDFIELANKRLNPQSAYIQGRIKLSGDLMLALKLGELL